MKYSIRNALSNLNTLKKGKKVQSTKMSDKSIGLLCKVEGNTIYMDLDHSCAGSVGEGDTRLRYVYLQDGPKGENSILYFSGGEPGQTYSVYVTGLQGYCIETITAVETTGAAPNPPEGEYVTINVFGCGDSLQDCCVFQSLPYVDSDNVTVFQAPNLCYIPHSC